jgi:hypothetical protein
MTVYKGKVLSGPKFPYVLLTTNFPLVRDRALSRDGHSHQVRVRATAVGFDAAGVRWAVQKVVDGLEGARPSVAGWNVGRVENVPNDQPMMVDTDVNVTGYGHPVYLPLDFTATASRIS